MNVCKINMCRDTTFLALSMKFPLLSKLYSLAPYEKRALTEVIWMFHKCAKLI